MSQSHRRPARLVTLLSALALLAGLAPRLASAQGVLTGELSGDRFGAALRGIGDFNGDGLPDFAVGAPENDNLGTNRGRVYVWYGREQNLPGDPDLTLSAGDGFDQFGYSLAGIGRFNNDAWDDLAVGAPYSDNGGNDRGQVYVFYGGPSPSLVPALTLQGSVGGEHFGWSLDGAFDFNHDGFDDLAVGAPDRATNGLQSGAVSLYFGGASPSTAPVTTWLGAQAQDWLGASVSRVGDFNNDDFDDLILGAPQPFALNPGRVYLVPGGVTPVPLSGATPVAGEVGGDRFGWSVAGGGDFDGDGFEDVAVGAPRHDGGATNNGAVYLYRGSAGSGALFAGALAGRAGGDELGTSVSMSGDWDGDGRNDIAAGAPGSDVEGLRAGEVDLWRGANPVVAANREVFAGPSFAPGYTAEDEFGSAVDFADYNGDGHAELLAGSPAGNLATGDESGLASLNFFPGTLVPVRLLDIRVEPAGDRVRLEWRVEDDGELLGFHVERRSGAADWRRRTVEILSGLNGRYLFEDVDPDLMGGGRLEYRLVAILRDGTTDRFGPFGVTNAPSVRPWLGLGYPNPAPDGVRIPVVMPESAAVTVEIFDAAGRSLRRLFSGSLPAGRTELWWDGRDEGGEPLPAGRYYYRMESASTVSSRSVIVLR